MFSVFRATLSKIADFFTLSINEALFADAFLSFQYSALQHKGRIRFCP